MINGHETNISEVTKQAYLNYQKLFHVIIVPYGLSLREKNFHRGIYTSTSKKLEEQIQIQ